MPSTGQRVSEYLLDAKIGAGTFGEVWRAKHHVWADQIVAIKIPNDPQYIRDLQREGLAVQGLDHPNIAKARGFDPYADPPYLIIEYVPGESLRQIIRQSQLKIDDAVAIMRQILDGLTHAHSKGLVHRDLKPENVLIHQLAKTEGYAATGVVKITDFGFGQRTEQQSGSIAYSMSLDHDQAKKIVGTIDYMSPEQRGGNDVDVRTDLYACGVMLFEMITGERPSGTECPSDLRTGVPVWIDEAFKRAYTRLDRRFANAAEMSATLKSQPPALRGDLVDSQGGNYPTNLSACPRCRRPVGAKDQYCMSCGVQLVNTVRRCGHCGGYPDANDQFCTHCGRTLGTMRIA